MYKMCPGRIVKNKFSKLTAATSSLIVQEYIADKLITKYCIHVFAYNLVVNPKI